jgi:hypothetical protein
MTETPFWEHRLEGVLQRMKVRNELLIDLSDVRRPSRSRCTLEGQATIPRLRLHRATQAAAAAAQLPPAPVSFQALAQVAFPFT